jgi:hypothetical protein
LNAVDFMQFHFSRCASLLVLLCALMVIPGCQSQPKGPPPPLPTPAASVQLIQYTGTPLSGPQSSVAAAGNPADALNVSVQWAALRTPPAQVQQSLAGRARLILAGDTGAPMLASPDLTKGVTFDGGADVVSVLQSKFAGPATVDFAPLGSFTAALPAKVTAQFAVAAASAGPPPRNSVYLRIAQVAGKAPVASEPLQMTLELSQDVSTTTQPAAPRSETAVLDRTLTNGQDQLAIVVPIEFNDSPARSLLALVQIKAGTTAAALAQCQANLQASAAAAAGQPSVGAVEGSAWAGFDSALAALSQPDSQRSALVFLSAETSAHICEDTALVAEDGFLDRLANTVAKRAAISTQPHTPASLAWVLDHAAFELLVLSDAPGGGASGGGTSGGGTSGGGGSPASTTAPAPLPQELRAILTLYAGEPARHPGSLDDIAHQSTSRQDLENRLEAENLVFLTDSSPASRVRAFDWLKSRGMAPDGFDPLGPAKQRREALDKALPADTN